MIVPAPAGNDARSRKAPGAGAGAPGGSYKQSTSSRWHTKRFRLFLCGGTSARAWGRNSRQLPTTASRSPPPAGDAPRGGPPERPSNHICYGYFVWHLVRVLRVVCPVQVIIIATGFIKKARRNDGI